MNELVSMPANIINYLKDTITQTGGEEEAQFAVYQLGRRWGREITKMTGEKCGLDELSTKATLISVHSGLTNVDFSVGEKIKAKPYDKKIEDNFFLAGYFSGVVTELLDENYVAKVKDDYFLLVKDEEDIESEISKMETRDEGKEISFDKIQRGDSYLIIEEDKNAKNSLNIFIEAVKNGIPGLCFTRTFPPNIKEKYEEVDFPVFWLSTVDGTDEIRTIKPDRFDKDLKKIVTSFFKAKQGIIILHGIEFLISNNDFKDILKFVQNVKDLTAVNNGIALIPLYPNTLSKKEFNNLKSELTQISI